MKTISRILLTEEINEEDRTPGNQTVIRVFEVVKQADPYRPRKKKKKKVKKARHLQRQERPVRVEPQLSAPEVNLLALLEKTNLHLTTPTPAVDSLLAKGMVRIRRQGFGKVTVEINS